MFAIPQMIYKHPGDNPKHVFQLHFFEPEIHDFQSAMADCPTKTLVGLILVD